MKEIKVKDTVQIRDYIPRGIVVMEDLDGKVVFRKENMILRAGRKLIIDSLFSDKEIEFTKLVIGKDGLGSTSDMEELKDPFDSTVDIQSQGIVSGELIYLVESEPIKLNEFNGGLLREMGLVVEDEDSEGKTKEILFSRLSVDPTPLSSQVQYRIKYYIYF